MKIKTQLHCISSACLIWSGCATLTGYQDGKTLSEGVTEVTASLNVGQSQTFNVDKDDILDVFNRVAFPNIEGSIRRGVTDKLDWMVRLSTTFNLSGGVKYQIIGDRNTEYAVSIGTEVQSFAFLTSGIYNIQFPLYTSIHPSEKLAIYLSPRFIHQFGSFRGRANWNYLGGNFGLLIGQKHKFAIDIGFYRLNAEKVQSVGLFTMGVGGIFRFGEKKDR